ncbi:hypothetical protein AQS8620_02625 [Aquimixticola soesokkakensis]|uniref:Uncharacterized protein n=2 Tax=Aquimixticola soesokkakensis TaxID=1519096 RepID=A0A1Y5TFG9_9RHOB|nr:hypothetical protein AQS8620_02625 [Aquimixticola soesokkakensis]
MSSQRSPLFSRVKTVKNQAVTLWEALSQDRVSLVAAGVAFYALLSIFPALSALLAVAGLVMDPARVNELMQGATNFIPPQAASIIHDQATAVAGSDAAGLSFALAVSLALAMYSASKGVQSLIQGLNIVFHRTENRGFVVLMFTRLALTAAVIFGLLLGLLSTTLVPILLSVFNFGSLTETLVSLGNLALMLAFTALGLSILFRFGPDRAHPMEHRGFYGITVGTVTGAVGWVVGSALFAYYVSNFGSYNESFGSIAGVVVLLMWLWLSAYIILIAAEIDAIRARGAEGVTKDR